MEIFINWIKTFSGLSEKAVKTRIRIPITIYVLVAVVKKRFDLDAGLYTILQIFSIPLFEKMTRKHLFSPPELQKQMGVLTKQLSLFD